jgi:predicted RNA methylase
MHQSEASRVDPSMLGQTHYPRRPLDFYPTPTKCTRSFLSMWEQAVGTVHSVWEPACGNGAISKVLADEGLNVFSSDIAAYEGFEPDCLADFLVVQNLKEIQAMAGFVPSAIITNPPYGDEAEQFVRHALKLTEPDRGVVAVLCRHEWSCAKGRRDIFKDHPAYAGKITLLYRPRWIEPTPGVKASSPRFSYSWFCWDWSRDQSALPADLYAE